MLELSRIQEIPLFAGLNETQLKKFQKVLTVQTVAENQVVIRDNDKSEEMFILLEGEVQISKALVPYLPQLGVDRQDKSIIRLSGIKREFFGEMAILEPVSKRMANVTATKRCVLAVLRREDFAALIAEDIHLGYTLMNNIAKILSARLGKANADIIKLAIAFSLALEK